MKDVKSPRQHHRTRARRREAAKPRRASGRQRSPQASHALELFADLRRFFVHDSQLGNALGWDLATVAEWRDGEVVRPQRAKMRQVWLLSRLCEEARPYLAEDTDVGAWMSAPLPNLQGASPASWLAERGERGLGELIHGLVDWMPRLPAGELAVIDEREASRALERAGDEDEGVREFQRMLAELD